MIYYNNIFGKTWLRSIVATIFHFFSWSPRSFFTFSFCGYPTDNRQQHQQAQIYSWDIRMDSLCIFNFKYIIWYPVNCVNILAAVPCLNYRASNWITVWMYMAFIKERVECHEKEYTSEIVFFTNEEKQYPAWLYITKTRTSFGSGFVQDTETTLTASNGVSPLDNIFSTTIPTSVFNSTNNNSGKFISRLAGNGDGARCCFGGWWWRWHWWSMMKMVFENGAGVFRWK